MRLCARHESYICDIVHNNVLISVINTAGPADYNAGQDLAWNKCRGFTIKARIAKSGTSVQRVTTVQCSSRARSI